MTNDFKSRLKQTNYAKHIQDMIRKNHLSSHVIFLGNLNEEQMAHRFQKSHVYISPSTIENESNSLSEAKLIGCPTISSYVGGVTSRIAHQIDGFLYPLHEPYRMAHYIDQLFCSDDLAVAISNQARENARMLFDSKHNLHRMIDIYHSVLG